MNTMTISTFQLLIFLLEICKIDIKTMSINNLKFADNLRRIYPFELEVKITTETNNPASYLNIMLSYDNDGHMNISLYDKHDDFNFSITNFPFLSGNFHPSPAYGVFISQLIRYTGARTKYTVMVPTTQKWHWTFYHGSKTYWNDAQQFCRSQNSRLLKLGDATRTEVLRHYKESDNYWKPNWDHIWSGLYFDGTVTLWDGECNDVLLSSDYTFWDNELLSSPKPCTKIDANNLDWKDEECSHEFHVVCEKYSGICTFEDDSAECPVNMDSNNIVVNSFEECKEKCRILTSNNEECWAVTYDQSANTCYGSFGVNPFDFTSIRHSCLGTEKSSYKICFNESQEPTTVFQRTHNIDTVLPNLDCGLDLTTTTVITTQSTEPSTTTTSITTEATTTSLPTTTEPPTTTTLSTTEKTTTVEPPTTTTLSTTEKTTTVEITTESDSTTVQDHTTTKTTATDIITTDSQTSISSTTLAITTEEKTSQKPSTIYSQFSTDHTTTEETTQKAHCVCSCYHSNKTLEERLLQLKEELTIPKKTTRKNVLKLISVPDDRTSAKGVGALGITLLVSVMAAIVIIDSVNFCHRRKSQTLEE